MSDRLTGRAVKALVKLGMMEAENEVLKLAIQDAILELTPRIVHDTTSARVAANLEAVLDSCGVLS